MKRWALIPIVALLAFAAPAQAKQHWRIVHPIVTQPACPAGIPVQTITVFNQANVRSDRLALVERAAVHQSLQLRRWWGTPCIQFGPGGWKLYLKTGDCGYPHGEHDSYGGPAHLVVWTGCFEYRAWASTFSHEIVESLVDPTAGGTYAYRQMADGTSWEGFMVEIADPVENAGYLLDGLWVSDFVYPSYYAGAMTTVSCEQAGCTYTAPLTSTASLPYDAAGTLHGPWQVYGRNR